MINKKEKGFTIIELLVVVVIIAILAAIVLVSVTTYITKGKDAAARGELSTLQINGAIHYDANSNYDTWITGVSTGATGFTSVYNALTNAGYTMSHTCDVETSGNCGATSQKWCG